MGIVRDVQVWSVTKLHTGGGIDLLLLLLLYTVNWGKAMANYP